MTRTNQTLTQLQADATVYYQKLRAYHWTVTGERFYQLHKAFEEAYERWAGHIDDVAERIVMGGGAPLLSLAAAVSASTLKEETGVQSPKAMVESVVADTRRLLETVGKALEAAEGEGQRGVVNLLDSIRDEEEKALWMLSATLQ
jgi:starvation-inducible DNA-binding protein